MFMPSRVAEQPFYIAICYFNFIQIPSRQGHRTLLAFLCLFRYEFFICLVYYLYEEDARFAHRALSPTGSTLVFSFRYS